MRVKLAALRKDMGYRRKWQRNNFISLAAITAKLKAVTKRRH